MIVESYFDGERLRAGGPFEIAVSNGQIKSIEKAAPGAKGSAFAMPSLFEGHCHLFLDGEELDALKRSTYLKGSRESMLKTALENVERYRACGVSGVRDAGDAQGVNFEVRKLVAGTGFKVLCAGKGIRKRKRYGSFMASEVDDAPSLAAAVRDAASAGADTVKIVLTGIIDFENGVVKDQPQFSLEELRVAVSTARERNLKTFVHCSGLDGLKLAVDAGVDSIEHGFFMDRSIVEGMAERGIAWCPTFIPVHFQMANPHYCGWSPASVRNLKAILENHKQCLRWAHELGVPILAGSDGGSYGVKHGAGLLEELELMLEAGIPLEAVLRSATTELRRLYGLPSNAIKPGSVAGFIVLEESPFKSLSALTRSRELCA